MSAEPVWMSNHRRPDWKQGLEAVDSAPDARNGFFDLDNHEDPDNELGNHDGAPTDDTLARLPAQQTSSPSRGWTVLQDLRSRRDLV